MDATSLGVQVVPLVVTFGTDTYRDGLDLTPQEFWRLAAARHPSTAAPSPAAFAEAYRHAAGRGAAAVVSVHVSGDVSSVLHNAAEAARDAPLEVRVVNSRQVGPGQALVVREAVRAAGDGLDAGAVASTADASTSRVRVLALVESVEFLRRGGRVGSIRALVSDLLRVRPVLTLDQGRPALVAKSRTRTRALEEILVRLSEPGDAIEARVAHALATDAEAVVARVRDALGVPVDVTVMGAATGSHLGPGAVAVAVLRRHG